MCQYPAQLALRRVFNNTSSKLLQGWQHLSGFGLLCNSAADDSSLLWGGDIPEPAVADPLVNDQVIHIGNYVVGDEECPLLFGVPGMRY